MNFKRYRVSKNLWDEEYIGIRLDSPKYRSIYVGNGTFTLSTTTLRMTGDVADLFFLSGNVSTGASTANNGVWKDNPKTIESVDGYVTIAYRYFDNHEEADPRYNNTMLNTGSQPLPYEPYSSEVWHDIPHYIHNTSTDTITTLPAVLYPNAVTATVGLKGQMGQSGTPTPTTPIQPQSCGDLETIGDKAGQYKIPILNNSQTTNVYLGEVESTRQIKKLVLTGSEDWSYVAGATSISAYYRFKVGSLNSVVANAGEICTHYQQKTISSSSTDIGFSMQNSTGYNGAFAAFRPYANSSESELATWKTYLQQQYANGTPVTVWYVLATPTTGVVNEPLMKIGDYADEVTGITIPVTAGANTISISTTLQPSEVSVNYHGWHPVADVHERDNGAWT